MYLIILKILLCLSLTFSVQAKRFFGEYTEFELPPNWDCRLEGAEWVCQSLNKDRQKEAIIILAAKVRGKEDSLEQYRSYLKKTKTFSLPGGNTQVSEAKYSKLATVNGHRWVDALHLASEVPGFYTRYLATVKSDIGVVVTFSVSKEHYLNYQGVFDNIVKTLRVFRQKQASNSQFKLKKRQEDLFQRKDQNWIDGSGENLDIGVQQQARQEGGEGASSSLFWLIIIIVGGAAFVLIKFRKKK